MKHGDISNKVSPIVVFNLENVVLNISWSRFRKKAEYELNWLNINYINKTYFLNGDFTVVYASLIPEGKLSTVEEFLEEHGALFNIIYFFETIQDLKKYLYENDADYLDLNKELIGMIGPRAHLFERR
jgi:hypothetical protein